VVIHGTENVQGTLEIIYQTIISTHHWAEGGVLSAEILQNGSKVLALGSDGSLVCYKTGYK